MKTITLLSAGLLVSIVLSGIMAVTGTRIGEKGRKDIIRRCCVNIICAVLTIALCFVWGKENGYTEGSGNFIAAAAVVIGIIVMICGIVEIKKTLGETKDDLITEELSDIRVIHVGMNNKILEGTADGKKRRFPMMGADKDLARQLKRKEISKVTVTYHTSDNRIESIYHD